MESLRHGDVIGIGEVVIPDGCRHLKDNVIALGEVTGHKHQIKDGEVVMYEKECDEIQTVNGILKLDSIIPIKFVEIFSDTAILSHEEHKPIVLKKGNYAFFIQREYEPEGWRRVSD